MSGRSSSSSWIGASSASSTSFTMVWPPSVPLENTASGGRCCRCEPLLSPSGVIAQEAGAVTSPSPMFAAIAGSAPLCGVRVWHERQASMRDGPLCADRRPRAAPLPRSGGAAAQRAAQPEEVVDAADNRDRDGRRRRARRPTPGRPFDRDQQEDRRDLQRSSSPCPSEFAEITTPCCGGRHPRSPSRPARAR